jgi:protocatechuate 3,4-dioxygenase beta subunit
MRPFLAVFLAALGLWAQPAVEGVVVDDIAHAPVPNALVQVRWTEARDGSRVLSAVNSAGPHTFTGEDGRFRIELETPAKFTLQVTAEGFITREGSLQATRYSLAAGESRRGITLKMAVEASLEGAVYDPELEKPVEGVAVQAWLRETMQGVVRTLPGGYAKTDDQGRYRMAKLKPGSYILRLKPPPRGSGDKLMYLQQAEALPLEVFSGARLSGIDFKMRRTPAVRVRGRFVTAEGDAPPAPIRLTVQRDWLEGMKETVSQPLPPGADFSFVPDLRGTTRLLAYAGAHSEYYGSTTVEVGDKDVEGVEVVMSRGAIFRGVVKSAEPLPEGLEVLFPREQAPNLLSHFLAGVDGATGRFTRDWVHPLPTNVRLQGLPAGWVLDEVTYNGHDLPNHRFEPDAGALDHLLELHIRRVANGIGGRVLERDKPVAGALVFAVREPVSQWGLRDAQRVETDEEGRYRFSTIRPGVWRLFALSPGGLLPEGEGGLPAGGGEKVVVEAETVVTVDPKVR